MVKRGFKKRSSFQPKVSAARQKQGNALGVSAADYIRLRDSQGNRCAICNRPPGDTALAHDHDHETNQPRELLCGKCNTALGLFDDSAQRLVNAALYLRRYGHKVEWPFKNGRFSN